jgi:hydrogenase expression/formation protein HypE
MREISMTLQCPTPIGARDRVMLAHGGGGRMMHELLAQHFYPAFANPALDAQHDGAVLDTGKERLAFTTDSYVVHPLIFPGGNIGTLAVNGTVNDLAMCGARPRWLSAGFILEEGLPLETLTTVLKSMREAAALAGVTIVTGDTKVVDRGKGDGLFINTAGIGVMEHDIAIAPSRVAPGDVVILSGDVGRHGVAIMAVREGLEFDSTIESDCAPLNHAVMALLDAGVDVHCLRDLTRGGLATSLIEIAETARLDIAITEDRIPVQENVCGACELLGLDPLYLANEGRMIAIVAAKDADRALSLLRSHEVTAGSVAIGEAGGTGGLLTLRSRIGTDRVLDMHSGEQLPRIC